MNDEQPTPHDWPEDWPHDNGMYFCKCFRCGVLFTGHKRRPSCKLCHAVLAQQEPAPQPAMNLPELPPSQMNVEVWDSEVRGLHSANAAYYTAEQMREYGEECARMERERCAKVADQYATSGGWTGRYFDGYVDAAKAIASALRDGWNAGDDYRDVIRKEPE